MTTTIRSQRGLGLTRVILICIGVVLLLSVLCFYGYINGLRTEGVQRENELSAQYLSNQNHLSAYISGFYEQVGIANTKSEKLNEILVEAVKGRYEKNGGFSADGAFFSAIAEAYPDLKGLDIYDKIVDYVSAGRAEYRNIQDKLLDMLRRYDDWRADGLVQSHIVSSVLGFPSKRLKARIGDSMLTGEEALSKMYQIVLASQAKEAYETGTMEPLKVH